MNERIYKALEAIIKQGKNRFVIYPYGKYGKIAKEILNNEFGIQELYVVDQMLNNNVDVRSVDFLKEDYEKNDFSILIAVDPRVWETSLEIHRVVMSFANLHRVESLLSYSSFFTPWDRYEKVFFRKVHKIAPIESISRDVYAERLEGAIAEAGVYQGDTAKYMNYLFPDRKLYLFDTFEGFNTIDQKNDDERHMNNLKIDYSGTSEELVLSKMHFEKNCIIRKGWFPKSAEGLEEKFVLVRLDMDLYNPIYAGLEFFYPKMNKGGYIIVHDCRSRNFDGARQAVIDFCKKENLGFVCMPDLCGSAIICVGRGGSD